MRGRRGAGLALLLAGGALLGWSGVAYGRGALARDRARAEWERLEARRAVVAATLAAGGAPLAAPGPGAPIARILVPRVGIDEVVVQGVGGKQLAAGPGHIPGTPMPGQRGNSVLSAHRDRHFMALEGVQPGDTIATESEYGNVTWVVTRRRILPKTARLPVASDGPRLTLTTCWPMRFLGAAPDRLVLTAEPVGK
ncbi:MAG: class D sortase [Gemmatimonadaceae bacterium]